MSRTERKNGKAGGKALFPSFSFLCRRAGCRVRESESFPPFIAQGMVEEEGGGEKERSLFFPLPFLGAAGRKEKGER